MKRMKLIWTNSVGQYIDCGTYSDREYRSDAKRDEIETMVWGDLLNSGDRFFSLEREAIIKDGWLHWGPDGIDEDTEARR